MIELKTNRDIFDFLYRKIENAKKSIHIAVAWFTDPELSKILLDKKNQRLDIKIILYNDQINSLNEKNRTFGDDLNYSNTLNFDYIMHHKFCIIDDEFVITGSYNWTVKARRYNKENILCISDKNIVKEYKKEFESLLKNSTSQAIIALNVIPNLTNKIEDIEILELEKRFNDEILNKIDKTAALKIGVHADLAYELVKKHTPVIAVKKLAEDKEGENIQNALKILTIENKLYLSFEESIIKTEYHRLFPSKTIELASKKLRRLHFFSNTIYSDLWWQY